MANPYFNATYYLSNNPDVFAAGINTVEGAWTHYVNHGAGEALSGAASRSPAPWFDISYYLTTNPDLSVAGLTAGQLFDHFVLHGISEGRQPSADANVNQASLDAYAAANEDLREAFGIEEGEEITDAQYAQLAQHFYQFGYYEERPGKPSDSGESPADGTVIYLKPGQDVETGTAGDDVFRADVVQNDLGLQTNTLGSGDRLDGGAGNDTLDAKVAAGAFVGGSVSMPIQPITQNIENVNLQAVLTSVESGWWGIPNNNDQVYLNAKDMSGVQRLASNYSDADLTVMNLTSKGLTHVSDMTIAMEYTGNADSRWDASDFTVLFDQDYLTRDQNSRDGLFYELMNQKTWDEDDSGNKTVNLIEFPLTEVIFYVDGVRQVLDVRAEMAEDAEPVIDTYAKLVDLLNAKIADTYPEYVGSLSFQTNGLFWDQENLRQGTRIELVNTNSELDVDKPSIALDTERPAGNLYWDFGDLETIVTNELVSINVDLEKVGLTGLGGELVIGSMNKGWDYNEWGYVDSVTDTVSGIEQFDVTVWGTNDKSSWLEELRSTNNQLREVNIVSAGGSEGNWADLHIGVGGEDEAGLKDVLTLDASAFQGDLNVIAELTNDIAAKYLNNLTPLEDMPALGTENAEKAFFDYDGGAGDDSIDVHLWDATNAIASSYADQYGTTFRSFNMTINGNGGDDFIIVTMAPSWATGPNTVTVLDSEEEDFVQTGSWSGISISGGADDDYIVLDGRVGTLATYVVGLVPEVDEDGEPVLDENDEPVMVPGIVEEEEEVAGGLWSFAVVFDQGVSNMANGADTIVNFNVGEQSFTQEVQVLDFANPNNDGGNQGGLGDGTNIVLHAGEWLNLVVEGKTYSYKATVDLDANGVAGLSADDFYSNLNPTNGAQTPASVNLGNLGPNSEGYVFADQGNGVLGIIAPAKDFVAGETAGTQGEGDIQTITSYIDHLDELHHNSTEVSGVRLDGPEGVTLVQGGYAQTGADFLDFSSYNVKGVVWQNFDITGSVETLDTLTSGIVNDEFGATLDEGDTFIYLREAQHTEGLYDIYYATVQVDETIDLADVTGFDLFNVTAGVPDFIASSTLVGTVQFVNDGMGTQQNFFDTNFLF